MSCRYRIVITALACSKHMCAGVSMVRVGVLGGWLNWLQWEKESKGAALQQQQQQQQPPEHPLRQQQVVASLREAVAAMGAGPSPRDVRAQLKEAVNDCFTLFFNT